MKEFDLTDKYSSSRGKPERRPLNLLEYCTNANAFFNLKVILQRLKRFFMLMSEIHMGLL